MNHKRVTVLRGGPSEEYQVSLHTGANVLQSLRKNYALVDDVIITKGGEWLSNGLIRNPEQILTGTDVVFVALHGAYGEDGEVQKIIQRLNIPFTGSRSLPSAVAFNKHLTKKTLASSGVRMPQGRLVTREESTNLAAVAAEIASSFGTEYIIKPSASGSSVGIVHVAMKHDLTQALAESLHHSEQVLIEEFIRGREATCAALENFRGESVYVFPAIEIIPPPGSTFFSMTAKYDGTTEEICPGNFSYSERVHLHELTENIHRQLGLSQYSRSDFIVRNGEIYFLEVNTLPGLTSASLFPKAAAAVGLSFDDLVTHLVETATT